MKNEPGGDIKKIFKAQYLGVEDCAFGDGYERAFPVSTITINSEHEYLLLRSVDSLTDDECKQIAVITDIVPDDGLVVDRSLGIRIYDKYNDDVWIPNPLNVVVIQGYEIFGYTNELVNIDSERMLIIIDYLRSIGMAMEFTYLDTDKKPVTLSVEDQINFKWIKIQEK